MAFFCSLSFFFSGSVVLFGRCFKGKIEAEGGLTDLNIDRGKGGGAEGEGEGDGGATVYFFLLIACCALCVCLFVCLLFSWVAAVVAVVVAVTVEEERRQGER